MNSKILGEEAALAHHVPVAKWSLILLNINEGQSILLKWYDMVCCQIVLVLFPAFISTKASFMTSICVYHECSVKAVLK